MPTQRSQPRSTRTQSACHLGIDGLLLALASFVFAGCLTARLQTGRAGFRLPVVAYQYEIGALLLHLLLATLPVLVGMALLGRLRRVQRTAWLQQALLFVGTLLVIRLGPPEAQVFGTTWTHHEVSMALFVQQWAIVLPVALAALLLRGWLRRRQR